MTYEEKLLERFKFKAVFENKVYDVEYISNEIVKIKIEENNFLKFHVKEIIILQSIGLRDENEKLIYEGDIVLIDDIKYIIAWSSDNASFVARCQEPNHPDADIYGFCDIEMEVLGNIYENPKILNKE